MNTKIDFKLISDVELDGIDTNDYPDFVDAYIVNAYYKGKPMSEKMIDEINDLHFDFVSECVYNELF